jgi:two-component system sensor kinase FixL
MRKNRDNPDCLGANVLGTGMDWCATRTDSDGTGLVVGGQAAVPQRRRDGTSFATMMELAVRWRATSKTTRTSYWLLGTAAISTAVLLFLAVAVALGFVLTTSRGEFERAQHIQAVLMQSVFLQEDLNDATSAVRRLLLAHNPKDVQRLAAESNSARSRARNLVILMKDSPAQTQMRESLPMIDRRLDALVRLAATADNLKAQNAARSDLAGLADSVDARLEQLRTQQGQMLAQRLNAADRSLLQAFALALAGIVFAPFFGIAGIWLLRHERDTRRLREMQNEMTHVQRLAVMGETAAMLAHDVSHPLTAANNYLGALRRLAVSGDLGDREKFVDLATRAAGQIHRASVILLRLRRFIEKREVERAAEEPAVLIQDAIALLGSLDNGITLKQEIEPALPAVLIDRVQIQQVLVNLMRNAAEAMQGAVRRELTISARLQDRNTVLFSLADSGSGLSREVAEKLFRPFVSSKREGMGVGLSICRSIVLEHGGTIWAEPNPGGGTIFRFRLPVAADA